MLPSFGRLVSRSRRMCVGLGDLPVYLQCLGSDGTPLDWYEIMVSVV